MIFILLIVKEDVSSVTTQNAGLQQEAAHLESQTFGNMLKLDSLSSLKEMQMESW